MFRLRNNEKKKRNKLYKEVSAVMVTSIDWVSLDVTDINLPVSFQEHILAKTPKNTNTSF